jgi:cell division protein FtsZ
MSDSVPDAEFTRNFGSYRMHAQREPVAVSSQGQIIGYFVGPEQYEAFKGFRESQQSVATADGPQSKMSVTFSTDRPYANMSSFLAGISARYSSENKPRLVVIGVGGGGINAVNTMIALNLPGVDFVAADTDAQHLMLSRVERRVQLGAHVTQGNRTNGWPEVARASAEDAAEALAQQLDGAGMVFIIAGMGGGTGAGAAPVIARVARERKILTIGMVTRPFAFEGQNRMNVAEGGITQMEDCADTLIVIPTQHLFDTGDQRPGKTEAFHIVDHALYAAVRGITDLLVMPGLVDLDCSDIHSVMAERGKAVMGTGEGIGENRALMAADAAVSNLLLKETNLKDARGLLINITGGSDLTLYELDEAMNRIRAEVGDDANIMVGMASDETLNGRIRISTVAAGIAPHSVYA